MNPSGWTNDPAAKPVEEEIEAKAKKAAVTEGRKRITVANLELNS